MKLDLNTFFHNLLHFRTNELGHNAAGNALVGTLNSTLSPLADGAIAQVSGGLVTPQEPVSADPVHPSVITQQALSTLGLIVGAHTIANSAPVPVASPTMESLLAQMALLQQQLAALQQAPPAMAAPPPIGARSL